MKNITEEIIHCELLSLQIGSAWSHPIPSQVFRFNSIDVGWDDINPIVDSNLRKDWLVYIRGEKLFLYLMCKAITFLLLLELCSVYQTQLWTEQMENYAQNQALTCTDDSRRIELFPRRRQRWEMQKVDWGWLRLKGYACHSAEEWVTAGCKSCIALGICVYRRLTQMHFHEEKKAQVKT